MFIDGIPDGTGQSKALSKKFLEGARFQPYFGTDAIRLAFYQDIRCGLLHQAEAKNKWLIRRKQKALLRQVDDGYIIDVERFHTALKGRLRDYFALLCRPESTDLRDKLWTKMNHICNVRLNRGAMEMVDASASDRSTGSASDSSDPSI